MTCADRACMRQDIHSMDSSVTRFVSCATATVLLLLSSGCGDREINESLPSILKIGILPDESRVKLDERYEPLRQYLSESLGIPCQLVFADTYDAMVESFGVGAVHLAYFGGVTYVQARTAYDAVPLVMRDVDTRFTTCFVAKADNACSTLASYEGSVIAFGSRLSTSGHLMPRHFLGDLDIAPEIFFGEVRYSGAHDTTIEWVRDGTATIGAVNTKILEGMMADGRIREGEFQIVWETPPYCDYVWAVQSSLGKECRKKLLDAFLALSPVIDSHESILGNLDAGGFYPANAEDFATLEVIVSNMGLTR